MMVRAVWIIRNEHDRYGAVLHCLRGVIRDIERGQAELDFALLHSILNYVDTFLDKYHHPKEDEFLFKTLRQRHAAAGAVLDSLEQDHKRGDRALTTLRKSLVAYEHGGAEAFDQFRAAALSFSDFQSSHAMKEESQILPLAEAYLTDEDWTTIDAAFSDHDDPLFGDKATAEFAKLHAKIVEMAPVPYGFRGVQSTVLRLSGITKRFGALVANDAIDLEIKSGEVLALLGENGAGKTTLMNILFGHYVADAGTIEVFGAPLAPGSPHAAIAAGLGMVHQHFTLADNLTVLDNVILGTKPLWAPWQNLSEARQNLLAVSRSSGLAVEPDRLVRELSVGERQRVEILKALYRGAKILILDEPTAVLTPLETDQLFDTIRELVDDAMSVIFISHKLKEVMKISDRVMVLRQGRVVADQRTASTTREELAHLMVGREIPKPKHVRMDVAESVLEFAGVDVTDGEGRKVLDGASLVVRRHEILGVAGVSGNGQHQLFQVIAGLAQPSNGTLEVLGERIKDATPHMLIERGVARIPEDRNSTGLIVDMTIWENLISERYRAPSFQLAGFVRRKEALDYSNRIIKEFDVRCPSAMAVTRLLSGGNLQKLILGRTLSHEPSLIIANQPTRGLDVGAVSFVHEQLLAARERGAGVLLISEDLDELLELSDRLVVMYGGRVSEPIGRNRANVRHIGLMMAGHFGEAEHAI